MNIKKVFKICVFMGLLFINACNEAPQEATDVLAPAKIDMKKPNPSLTRSNRDILIVGTSEAAGNFLPIYYATAYDAPASALVFEGLLSTDRHGKYIPWLAQEMPEISEDGKSYTFKIKRGIKFHNGKELNADDVVFSYTIIADPSYDGRFTSTVNNMEGYDEYSTGKTKIFKGVEKLDEYTVRFNFKENFATNIAYLSAAIMPSDFYAYDHGDLTPVKAKMQNLCGTGPYRFTNFVPRQYFEMTADEDYWGKSPEIDRIIVKFITDSTDVQELIKGDIDILPDVIEPEKLELTENTGFIDKVQYLRHGYGYLKFNTQDTILKDVRVRQALSYALDREAFLDIFFKGLGVIINAPISKAFWTYDSSLDNRMINYSYNPKKANELLESAGWIRGQDGYRYKEGEKLSIHWASIKDLRLVDILTPILLQNWKEIGAEVIIQPMDFNSLMEKVYVERKGFSMFNMATSESSFPDPSTQWHSSYDVSGGNNTCQFRDEENDKILDSMIRELDNEKYKVLWQEWAVNINKKAPMIPLYTNTYTTLVNRRVKNFTPDTLWPWYAAIIDAKLEVSEP